MPPSHAASGPPEPCVRRERPETPAPSCLGLVSLQAPCVLLSVLCLCSGALAAGSRLSCPGAFFRVLSARVLLPCQPRPGSPARPPHALEALLGPAGEPARGAFPPRRVFLPAQPLAFRCPACAWRCPACPSASLGRLRQVSALGAGASARSPSRVLLSAQKLAAGCGRHACVRACVWWASAHHRRVPLGVGGLDLRVVPVLISDRTSCFLLGRK